MAKKKRKRRGDRTEGTMRGGVGGPELGQDLSDEALEIHREFRALIAAGRLGASRHPSRRNYRTNASAGELERWVETRFDKLDETRAAQAGA